MQKLYKALSLILCFLPSFYATLAQTQSTTTLWGMSSGGGTGGGNIFSYYGGTTTNRFAFQNTENPYGALTLSKDETVFYGMTTRGGKDNLGTLFKYDLDTRIHTTLYSFRGQDYDDGANPFGTVLEGSDGALYGMTCIGGKYNKGVLFRYDGKYTILYTFGEEKDGASPYGSLIEIDGTLIGMTSAGGETTTLAAGAGTVFSIRLDGSNYKVFRFPGDGRLGQNPFGSLTMGASNAVLYGMTRAGSNDVGAGGVLFEFDYKNFVVSKVLHGFVGGSDGSSPYGDVLYMKSGNTSILLGLTYAGGASGVGTLFSYTLGTRPLYAVRHSFSNDVGGMYPAGSLIRPKSDSTFFYGTTSSGGGTTKSGVLFKWNPTNGMVNLSYFDGKNAQSPFFSKLVEYIPSACGSPSPPTATATVSTCVGSTPTALTATATKGYKLLWYGTDPASNPSLTASVPPTSVAGTNTYYVSQILKGCESGKTAIRVIVNNLPEIPGVTALSYCQGAPTVPLTATSTTKLGLLSWYGTNATGGTASTTAPTPSSAVAGTVNYYVSQTESNGCESPRASLPVTVNTLPNAPGTAPIGYCLNATASPLTATASWYNSPVAAGARIYFSLNWYGTNATGGQPGAAPTPVTSKDGVYNYYVSQTDPFSRCEGPRGVIAVTVNLLPAPPSVVTPLLACFNGVAPSLSATGSSLLWYVSTTANGTTTPPTLLTDKAGTFNYFASQTDANGCQSAKATVVYTVNNRPNDPMLLISNDSLCQYEKPLDLSTIVYDGTSAGTLFWYKQLSKGVMTNPSKVVPTVDSSIVGTSVYYVYRYNNGCESNHIKFTITVSPLPTTPEVPSISPICEGEKFDLTTKAIPLGQFYWYKTEKGGVGHVNPYSIGASLSTPYYYLIDSTKQGCKSARVEVKIPVVKKVLPAVSITVPSTSICTGSTVTFTATAQNGGTAPTYQWFRNGAITGPAAAANTLTVSNLANDETVYAVMVSSEACVSNTTATSNSIKMTVTTTVVPVAKISTASANVCAGTAVTFEASIANGGMGPTYQWQVNKNPVTGATGSTFTSTTLANKDTVTVLLTSNSTCVNTALRTVLSNKIGMTLMPNVAPSATVVATSGTSICTGAVANFKATAVNGGNIPTYQWVLNGTKVGIADTTSTYLNRSLVTGDKISVVLTSKATCLTSNNVSSNTLTMTVSSVVPTVSISPASSTICQGASATFTATAVNGGTSPSYLWRLNGNDVGRAGTTNVFTSTNLQDGDVVSVVLYSKATCASPSTAVSNDVAVKVNPIVTPTVSIASTTIQRVLCENASVSFAATPAAGGATVSYQWQINKVNVSGATASAFTTTSLKNGDSVNVVINVVGNCLSSTTALSNKIGMRMTVNKTPSVSLLSTASTICKDSAVYITANPVEGGSEPSYEWKVNGIPIDTTNSNTFTSKTLANNSLVSVVMTPNALCVTAKTVASTNTVAVTVKPNLTPTVTIATPTQICKAAPTTFTATQLNAGATAKYQWRINNVNVGGLTAANTLETTALSNTDVVSVLLRSQESCLVKDSALAATSPLVVGNAPSIGTQPTSSQACEGENVTLAVIATGTNLTYQWSVNGNAIAGATKANLLLSKVSASMNNNQYSVAVQGLCAPSVNSATAVLTVLEAPTLVVEPQANATCALGSVHFVVVAKGSNLSYQWQRNGVNIQEGGLYEGVTNDTLTVNSVTIDQNGSSYRVLVNNVCKTQTSTAAVLTVGANFVTSVAVSASDTVVCEGAEVTFVAKSSNGGNAPVYKWLRNGSPLSNANGASYVSDSLNVGDAISCEMTSSNSCVSVKTVVSSPINMDVNTTPPTIENISEGAVCDTGKALLTAKASAGIVIWYGTASGGVALDTTTSFATPTLTAAATYYAEAFFKGCTSAIRMPATVSYSSKPSVYAGHDQRVCESLALVTLKGTSSTGHLLWRNALTTGLQPTQIDSLTAQYTIQASDVSAGTITFIASSEHNGACPAVSDTLYYKVASAGSGAGYIVSLDSSVVAGMILRNFPSTQTAYKANDPSTWKGVKTACGYVTEIRWPAKGLDGTLDAIDGLAQLEVLDLSNNQLDSIHTNLSFISSRLRVLNLSNNTISYKRVISWLDYAFLDTVQLSHNHFANRINFVNHAPVYIDLSHNDLPSFAASKNTGAIGTLKTQYFDLSYNQLNDFVLVDSLVLLEHFDLSHNRISGRAEVVPSLTKMKYFDASYNKLSGSVPSFAAWPLLETLDLAHNGFEGYLDILNPQIGLKVLDLGNNAFRENIQGDFRAWSGLQYLALDSNGVVSTADASGITALPLLPQNTGLQLWVGSNHLDFADLAPYTALLDKVPARYVPQFPDIDQSYATKPAQGSFMSLNVSLTASGTTYQWTKFDPLLKKYVDLNLPTAQEATFKKQFVAADTGTYATIVENTNFPRLTFYRRPISVEACEFSYNTNFFVKKPTLDKCFGIDTLYIEFTTKDHKPVSAYSNVWFFNDLSIQSADQKSIPVHVSGVYTFLAYDSSSGCSIFSKDTIMVKTTTKINPALEIAFNVADSSLVVTSNLTDFESSSLQWVIDGYPIAGATNKKLRVYYNASYQLISIKTDSCSAISKSLKVAGFKHDFLREEHTLDGNGQLHLNVSEALQVYPSPTQGAFHVMGLTAGDYVKVLNVQGVVVWEGYANSGVLYIGDADLQAGMYMIEASQNDIHRVAKLIVTP